MRAIYVRSPNDEECQALQNSLKYNHGISVRRSQIILMSADQKLKAGYIGQQLGLSDQLVRNVIHAFNKSGAVSPDPGSRAHHDDQRALDDQAREWLGVILSQSPRAYGYETSLWCYSSGYNTPEILANDTPVILVCLTYSDTEQS